MLSRSPSYISSRASKATAHPLLKRRMSSHSWRYTPLESWVLAAFYNEDVFIWDYEQASLSEKLWNMQFACEIRHVQREEAAVHTAELMTIQVYNWIYNTMKPCENVFGTKVVFHILSPRVPGIKSFATIRKCCIASGSTGKPSF